MPLTFFVVFEVVVCVRQGMEYLREGLESTVADS